MQTVFPPSDVKVWSIGELTRDIKSQLEDNYGTLWVEGEVSNLAKPASGHLYLTLKDDHAPLQTVIYRGVAIRMRFDLEDGMRVIARGRLTLYPPRGQYQLQVEEVQPKGIGPLELAFRQLKEKLSTKGYFDKHRKRTLPRIPRRVGLITSGTGSAVRDMLEILGRRWPIADVWVCPVRVQGEGAAEEISAAFAFLNRLAGPDASPQHRLDVLIVGRGGGSLEDLWPFNEEMVAHAIYSSRIPVITGVGHEDDFTIADMVADVRALTPSEAAERVCPNRVEVLEWLSGLEQKFRMLLRRRLESARTQLDALASRRCFEAPLERIRENERHLDDWNERLQRAIHQRLQVAEKQLEADAAHLESLSPLNVLARGYSLTRTEDNTVIRDANQVKPGDRIETILDKGRIISRVEEQGENDE